MLTDFYDDADGDGYGVVSPPVQACTAPVGKADNATDCNDSDASAYPGASETCDQVDDDCDSSVDEGVTTTYFADSDGDGYGVSTTTTQACSLPGGYADIATDCDDQNGSINPGENEVCDSIDQDCDTSIDEGVIPDWYPDNDGDSYGVSGPIVSQCDTPAGHAGSTGDCEDDDVAVHPGASETCNAKDDDCDGLEDEDDDGPGGVIVCPDPMEVAPTPLPGRPTVLADAIEFLYTQLPPVQQGVVANAIDARRAGVLQGVVRERLTQGQSEGDELAGVKVSIRGKPEYGYTYTRDDGEWDLAVNGGGPVTVRFEREGYLPIQRTMRPKGRRYEVAKDVSMTPLDSLSTSIDLGSIVGMAVAQSSVTNDARGQRRATVMFPEDTNAYAELPSGGSQQLNTLTVRATEYTKDSNGREAMPGNLPVTSAYTYAAEFSVDEALALGAESVYFTDSNTGADKYIPFYVEDFLGMKVGINVPTGYYDPELDAWIPSESGLVIRVLGVDGNGDAEVDINDDGYANPTTDLYNIGMTDEELQSLGTLYGASAGNEGIVLWRVMTNHFSAWDTNWPFEFPWDAIIPPWLADLLNCDPCASKKSGSIIDG